MAKSSLLDGFAYGVLNELLGFFRTDDGYASPSRYEVIITPPAGIQGIGTESPFGSNKDVIRRTSLEVTSVSFPGMTIETQDDTNIYGPTRKIAVGQTFADITTTIRLSNDHKERNFTV
jgi:hypothetical protein